MANRTRRCYSCKYELFFIIVNVCSGELIYPTAWESLKEMYTRSRLICLQESFCRLRESGTIHNKQDLHSAQCLRHPTHSLHFQAPTSPSRRPRFPEPIPQAWIWHSHSHPFPQSTLQHWREKVCALSFIIYCFHVDCVLPIKLDLVYIWDCWSHFMKFESEVMIIHQNNSFNVKWTWASSNFAH